MPHGCCYSWQPAVIWLHLISDACIALAYYSIPITLIYFVRRRHDVAFGSMFLCFAVFIVACGTTHVMEILNIWHPVYWLSGVIKAITAVASIGTAILLVRLMPQALALPSPSELRRTNQALQREVVERTQAHEKITALHNTLLLKTAELEATNQELESFGYSISHDLRAPLRHIDGYVSLLREEVGTPSETSSRYMNVISAAARQMGLLIDNLLEFSRTGRAALRPMRVDMNVLVQEMLGQLTAETRGRSIQWKIAPLPQVTVDKTLFGQVWANLLGNALKYSRHREKAEIAIECRDEATEYVFSIRDNGAGFNMEHADKLFGIFQRLHHQEEFEGTGIGLANVQRIVVRHGGRVWAEGELNKGATFYFTVLKLENPS